MRLASLLLLVLLSPASAQTAGGCVLGTAQTFLTANDVQAALLNTGSLFFGGGTTSGDGYLVPKAAGNLSPVFAAGLWVGGVVESDVDIRTSGARYSGFQFAPGPLAPGATLPATDCSGFDRIYSVTMQDLASYESGIPPSRDLAEWPAALGAPVLDGDGDPTTYDLEDGDRPLVTGDQTVFWVMNDVGVERVEPASMPLGVEVQAQAFAFRSTDDALDQATFYRLVVINRNPQPIEDARVGLYVDPDLGDASDDYVGTDVARSMVFAYNASAVDAEYGTPPALGVDLLSGAGASIHFPGTTSATSLPRTPFQYYAAMGGAWGNGQPMTEGGVGFGGTGNVTRYAYPGDPVAGAYWSEVNTNRQGSDSESGDRRMAVSAPSVTLAPGDSTTLDVAVLFAQGTSNLNSVTRLRAASDRVQGRYDAGTLFPAQPLPPDDPEPEPEPPDGPALAASPNPVGIAGRVEYRLKQLEQVHLALYDVLGREVVVLDTGEREADVYAVPLDVSSLAPGVYVLRLTAGETRASTRVTVVR